MLKFDLSPEMVAVIGGALENAPYKVAAPVLQELQKQIDAQKEQKAADKPVE